MAETKHEEGHNGHGPTFQLYMIVAVALAVFTATSFMVNALVTGQVFTPILGFVLILAVAICKTTLVGMYFMHLKYDWAKLFFLIIPAFILGAMLMIVLLPDFVLAWGPPP